MTPDNFCAAFTSSEGWGTFSQKRNTKMQEEKIEVKWGQLRSKTLAFDLPEGATAGSVSVICAGKEVKSNSEMKNITL